MKICVFGAASESIDQAYKDATEEMGALLAQNGHELVFGAGRNGLMGAAARGFKKGGGYIYGVIPHFFREEKVEEIYEYCDELIYTDTMHQRKKTMEDRAEAFIIVPGGIGTFEEFFEILTLRQLGRHNKPIIIYNLKGFYNDLISALESAVEKGFIKEGCLRLYKCAENVEDVIRLIDENARPEFTLKELKEG